MDEKGFKDKDMRKGVSRFGVHSYRWQMKENEQGTLKVQQWTEGDGYD